MLPKTFSKTREQHIFVVLPELAFLCSFNRPVSSTAPVSSLAPLASQRERNETFLSLFPPFTALLSFHET